MSDLIQKLSDKKLLNIDESLVLAEGLDEAVIGITTIYPKRVVYDYWRCIDILLKDKDSITVGKPYVKDARIELEVVSHKRDKKILVYKMRPKKKTRKKGNKANKGRGG